MGGISNCFDTIADINTLLLAYRRARRGKRCRDYAAAFDYQLGSQLLQLQDELHKGDYRLGPYRQFTLREAKARHIDAPTFRDRVVQHAICAVLNPFYDRQFIHDSYACRVGKGTHRAVRRLQYFLQLSPSSTELYACKIDVSKYYASINHKRLKDLLATKIHDARTLELLACLIDSTGSGTQHDHLFGPDSPYHTHGARGVPIGNLTSQLFANIYLHQADLFIKQRLKIRHYLRYMDDLLLLHPDKRQLQEWQAAITDFLQDDLYLTVNPRKVRIYPTRQGVDFVGYVVFRDHIRLRGSTLRAFKKRYRRQLKSVADGRLSAERVQQSLQAWQAHAAHANAFRLVQTIRGWEAPVRPARPPVQLPLWSEPPEP